MTKKQRQISERWNTQATISEVTFSCRTKRTVQAFHKIREQVGLYDDGLSLFANQEQIKALAAVKGITASIEGDGPLYLVHFTGAFCMAFA